MTFSNLSEDVTRILIIDPRQSGISGDMLLAALTDFYNIKDEVLDLLNKICKYAKTRYKIEANYDLVKTTANGIIGHQLKISIEKDFPKQNVEELMIAWKNLLGDLNFNSELSDLVFNTFNRILKAEMDVHGKTNELLRNIYFHELNSIDTIIDITVCNYILYSKNKTMVMGLPTAIGTGRVKFSHGSFSLPGPAVSYLLEHTQFPFVNIDYTFELTTPTGLALLTALTSQSICKLPTATVTKSGIGLGRKQNKGFPNFLKIWEINEIINDSNVQDVIYVLETHVDDVTGEILGSLFDELPQLKGIHDVAMYPILMKKNRPGQCIRILFDPNKISTDKLSIKIMKMTGTLGIRFYPSNRHKTVREIKIIELKIKDKFYSCKIKLSKLGSDIIQIKPEYEDLKQIASKTGLSVNEIQKIALLDAMNNSNK